MKRYLFAALCVLAFGTPALAATMPPALPQLDAAQSSRLAERMKLYRTEVEGRVARGEITAGEAERLLAWREWQIAREIADLAPPNVAYITPNFPPRPGDTGVPPDYRPVAPAPIAPAPYYYSVPYPVYAPWPAYPWPYAGYGAAWPAFAWGATVCGGGFGHHFHLGVCL